MVKVPKGYRSKNVRDTRSIGGSSRSSGGFGRSSSSGGFGRTSSRGGLGASPQGKRGGCGLGFLIMLAVLAFLVFSCLGGGTAGDPLTTGGSSNSSGEAIEGTNSESEEEEEVFTEINFFLDDLQEGFWPEEFAEAGLTYEDATVTIFENGVSTGGCGNATSAVGPFYCPADNTAYIDIEYMFLLQEQLGAEGDFAPAYILAHEIAHHVQNLLGINAAMRQAQSGASTAESNALSVALELQADCFAGAWATDLEARNADIVGFELEEGDLDEAVNAATAVGDDAITGSANQENFTHGSSAQRMEWFLRGFREGTDSCTTFDGALSPG